MWKDPIVEEVRAAGAKLAEEAGNDLHQFCENLRRAQQPANQEVVRREFFAGEQIEPLELASHGLEAEE